MIIRPPWLAGFSGWGRGLLESGVVVGRKRPGFSLSIRWEAFISGSGMSQYQGKHR